MFDADRSGQIGVNEFLGLYQYIEQWKKVFEQYDTSRLGMLNHFQMKTALVQFGYAFSEQTFSSLLHKYDEDGNQQFTLDEFIAICCELYILKAAFTAESNQSDRATITYEAFLNVSIFLLFASIGMFLFLHSLFLSFVLLSKAAFLIA